MPNRHATLEKSSATRWSSLRLLMLWLMVCAAVTVISTRLAYLQLELQDAFVDHETFEPYSIEPVSAIDGRILSADGQVLAYDHQTFHVYISYRWLQDPPDPRWLKSQIKALLTPEQRHDKDLVEATTKEILSRRDQMWQHLAQLAGLRLDDLDKKRERIQTRVERLRQSVRKKREAKALARQQQADAQQSAIPPDETLEEAVVATLKQVRDTVASELTQAPKRQLSDNDLVLKEELTSHLFIEDVSREAVLQIEAFPTRFPGVSVDVTTKRIYPLGDLASHIIGYQTKSIDDWGIVTTSRNRGIEQARARQLSGQPGQRQIDLQTGESKIIHQAVAGEDVTITIHSQLQADLEGALDEIITPVERLIFASPDDEKSSITGGSIAAASAPRPNLSLLADGDPEYWDTIKKDTRSPLLARTFQAQLTPGSTFKVVSSIGLLNSGKWDPLSPMECQGFLDNPNKFRCYIYKHYSVGHGPTTLNDALARSCNVYFFTAARQLGPQVISDAADLLGLGRPTGLDLTGEKPGYVPSPARYRQQNQMWFPGETLGLAIGQSTLQVTPLQMTRIMAAIANGGELVTPHFAHTQEPPSSYPTGIPQRSLDLVKKGLISVVSSTQGTGYKTVRHPEIKIAGKTGTAETGGSKGDHAWFAGFVPADNPQYAFTVVLENAGSGSSTAGPLAKHLVQSMLDLKLLAPDLKLATQE